MYILFSFTFDVLFGGIKFVKFPERYLFINLLHLLLIMKRLFSITSDYIKFLRSGEGGREN